MKTKTATSESSNGWACAPEVAADCLLVAIHSNKGEDGLWHHEYRYADAEHAGIVVEDIEAGERAVVTESDKPDPPEGFKAKNFSQITANRWLHVYEPA